MLRLTADDGEVSASDEVTITVLPESTNQPPSVDAGSDLSVVMSSPAVASLAGDRTEVVASRVVGVTIGGNNRGSSDPTSAAVSSAAKFVPSVLTKQK